MGKIKDAAMKAASIATEISGASKEQSTGISQVNLALLELDKVTQINSASAEETAASSLDLRHEVTKMNNMIDDLGAIIHGQKKTKESHV